jgi:DNA-binding XRE family transcriptional regulator
MEPSELIKWRKDQKYTQQELADLLGVARMTIVRWEKAMREIPTFLHLALRSLEKKGGGGKAKRARKGTLKRRG